jgi:hypothetical protein
MLDAHAHVVATMSESIKQGYEKAGTMNTCSAQIGRCVLNGTARHT